MNSVATQSFSRWALLFSLLSSLLGLVSCAGPTHPWGNHGLRLPPSNSEIPIQIKSIVSSEDSDSRINTLKENSKATISFTPSKQNLTDISTFTVHIDNKDVIERNFKLNLYYNGVDVTESWLKNSKMDFNYEYTAITITFNTLKLLADGDHHIVLRFQNDQFTKAVTATFEDPTCSLNQNLKMGIISTFRKATNQRKRSIASISKEEEVNPNFIAGLIAQESPSTPVP